MSVFVRAVAATLLLISLARPGGGYVLQESAPEPDGGGGVLQPGTAPPPPRHRGGGSFFPLSPAENTPQPPARATPMAESSVAAVGGLVAAAVLVAVAVGLCVCHKRKPHGEGINDEDDGDRADEEELLTLYSHQNSAAHCDGDAYQHLFAPSPNPSRRDGRRARPPEFAPSTPPGYGARAKGSKGRWPQWVLPIQCI